MHESSVGSAKRSMFSIQQRSIHVWSDRSCGRLTTFLGITAGATHLVTHFHLDISWGSCLKRSTPLSILHGFHPLGEAHGFILRLVKLFGLLMYFCTCLVVAVCQCIPVQLGEIILILVFYRLWTAFYNCSGRIIRRLHGGDSHRNYERRTRLTVVTGHVRLRTVTSSIRLS